MSCRFGTGSVWLGARLGILILRDFVAGLSNFADASEVRDEVRIGSVGLAMQNNGLTSGGQ